MLILKQFIAESYYEELVILSKIYNRTAYFIGGPAYKFISSH